MEDGQRIAYLLDLYATMMAVGKRPGFPMVVAAVPIEPSMLLMLIITFLPPVSGTCFSAGKLLVNVPG